MPQDSNEAAAAKIAEERRKARAAEAKAAEDTLDKQAKTQAVNNTEAMRRMDEARPTPTQRENDMARLGVPVEKEDDGSGPDPATLSPEEKARRDAERQRAMEGSGGAPYRTREAAPKPPVAPKP